MMQAEAQQRHDAAARENRARGFLLKLKNRELAAAFGRLHSLWAEARQRRAILARFLRKLAQKELAAAV